MLSKLRVLFRFCDSAVIVPICTKVDTKNDVLSDQVCKDILSWCQKMIQRSLKQTGNHRKIILLDEIIHFTSKDKVEDPYDPRKNSKYLRDLIAALCDFHFKGHFCIPNSWVKIGKYFIIFNCKESSRIELVLQGVPEKFKLTASMYV